jgi:hypothetical protein
MSFHLILCICFTIFVVGYSICKCKERFTNNQSHDYLSVICRIRDEHFLIKTFVPYYLSQGVDKIYLITDRTTKPYPDEIMKNKAVEVIDVDHEGSNKNEMENFNKLMTKIQKFTTWIINVDADEFIYTKENATIRTMLETEFSDFDCVCIPWVMFAFNGLQHDADDVINDYVYRWDHDRNSVTKSEKARDAINQIKSIFKAKSYKSSGCHRPRDPTKKVFIASSLKGKSLTSVKKVLRETDIADAFLLCNHYRYTSIDNAEKKCDTTTFSEHNLKVSSGLPTCVTDIIANDRPEIVDETLKLKWRLINLQKNKRLL